MWLLIGSVGVSAVIDAPLAVPVILVLIIVALAAPLSGPPKGSLGGSTVARLGPGQGGRGDAAREPTVGGLAPGPAVPCVTEVREMSDRDLLRAWRVSRTRLTRPTDADQTSAQDVAAHRCYHDELLRRHPGGLPARIVEETPVRGIPPQRHPPPTS